MRKMILTVIVFALILASPSIPASSASSAKNLVFVIEFTKPIASVQNLNVIFRTRPTPQIAEQVVRDSISLAIKYFPPTVEVMGVAWYSSDGVEYNEEKLNFANGKSFLVYNPKTKAITYL